VASQKERDYIETKKNSLLRERSNEVFFCKECGESYKGYQIHLLEGFGSEGSKHYVSLRYCCPEGHIVREEKSKLFSDTIIDHLFTLVIIAAIILFFILMFRYCGGDISEYERFYR